MAGDGLDDLVVGAGDALQPLQVLEAGLQGPLVELVRRDPADDERDGVRSGRREGQEGHGAPDTPRRSRREACTSRVSGAAAYT